LSEVWLLNFLRLAMAVSSHTIRRFMNQHIFYYIEPNQLSVMSRNMLCPSNWRIRWINPSQDRG
jgi:hypothetical protein